MTIQYVSDLHLEFPENKKFLDQSPIVPVGEILILAGDIVPFAVMDKHKFFFDDVSSKFEIVYWLPGNHEYYHFDAAKKCGSINEKIRSNVWLVNDLTMLYKDARLIFSVLWSKISETNQWQIERSVSDFQYIRYSGYRFSTEWFNQLHEESLHFITSELQQKTDEKTIVVTHHVPTLMNYPAQYKGSSINEAFAVELSAFIEKCNAGHWIYGHHHFNTPDFKIGNTTLHTNQLGYVRNNEHEFFNPAATIEI
jgi:Icc-related predicted phosphoesterase